MGDQRRIGRAGPGGRRCRRAGRRAAPPRRSSPRAGPPTRRCRTAAGRRGGRTTSRAGPRRRAPPGPAGRRPRPPPTRRGRGPARCGTSRRRRCRSSTTGATPRASGHRPGRTVPARSSRRSAPGVEAGPGPVAGDHRQLGGEPRRHRVEVAVPAAPDRAAVQPDRLLVEGVERGDEQRAAVGGAEHEGPAGRRPVGEQEEAVEVGAGQRGQRRTRSAGRRGRAGPSGAPPASRSPGVKTGQPTDGLVERPAGEAVEVGERLDPEHEHRQPGVGLGQHREPQVAAGEGHTGPAGLVGWARGEVGRLGPLGPHQEPRPEPVGLDPPDPDRARTVDVGGEPLARLHAHRGIMPAASPGRTRVRQ